MLLRIHLCSRTWPRFGHITFRVWAHCLKSAPELGLCRTVLPRTTCTEFLVNVCVHFFGSVVGNGIAGHTGGTCSYSVCVPESFQEIVPLTLSAAVGVCKPTLGRSGGCVVRLHLAHFPPESRRCAPFRSSTASWRSSSVG